STSRLPIALGQTIRALLSITSACGSAHFYLHQPFSGKADHLTQNIGVGGLFDQSAKVHHIGGHRWSFRIVASTTRHYRKIAGDHSPQPTPPPGTPSRQASDVWPRQ